jgi:hypothetical protein
MWKKLEGRCISCGYLCKRIDLLTSTIYEASVEDRNNFNFLSHPESPRQTKIWCFAYKEPLYEEFERLKKLYDRKRDSAQICGQIVMRDTRCERWFPYKPFMSPKEHYERFQMMQLEQERRNFERRMEHDRRKFEQRMDKDRREFDLKLFKISQEVQKNSKNIVEKSDRFNRRVTFWIIILAVLEVLGTLLALIFPNGFAK